MASDMVYRFTYKWEDDSTTTAQNGCFIGTEQDFSDMRICCQELWGFGCWDIVKTPATADDLKVYESD